MERPSGPAGLETPAAAHWDFPRSVAGVALVVQFGAEHGVQPRTVLAGLGVGAGVLEDGAAVVPARVELDALANLLHASGDDPLLGLELGSCYHVTSFGILGYALMSSRTVREAMNLALRFLDLSYIFAAPVARLEGDQVAIELRPTGLPAGMTRLLLDRDTSAIHTVLTELVPGGVPFSSLELGFEAPADVAAYERVLGVRPDFGAGRTVLRFDTAHLDRRLPQANPHSQALAEQMCREVVARRRGRSGITHELRMWITRNAAYDVSSARAAQAFAISPRTLRRRLTEAGTTYQALLDEVRLVLAEEMLGTGVLDVEDVALRLGYAEASSFIHAFKRWRGMTPARFRREHGRTG